MDGIRLSHNISLCYYTARGFNCIETHTEKRVSYVLCMYSTFNNVILNLGRRGGKQNVVARNIPQ